MSTNKGAEAIRLESVTKQYPQASGQRGALALANIDLGIREGEVLCLIGGSGSGKTTLLRLINRLEDPSAGRVLVGGIDNRKTDAVQLRRSMGYVVQSGGLFPHMNVRSNIALPCSLQGWSPERTAARVLELLEMVQLPAAEYADRFPSELSGGQRQRVSVARAFASDPGIVLLDEPFGALDPITRAGIQQEFLSWSRNHPSRTSVLVTHDLDEAFLLGDRIALLHEGSLLQVGTPEEFRSEPADEHVRAFLDLFQRTRGGPR